MHSKHSPLSVLPNDLPWNTDAYLLLDGVSVEGLSRKLYEWSENPQFEMLYLETRWAELADVSPCLIRLSGPHDPALTQFLEHAEDEWGYLIFSTESQANIIKHLRWLVCVQPEHGDPVMLRLADPAVMNALLAQTETRRGTYLLGPVEQCCIADALSITWHQHRRPGDIMQPDYKHHYQLSETEENALAEVSFRQTILGLSEHMRRHFPAYGAGAAHTERMAKVRALADEAYKRGFSSAREITLYANLFGYLGDNALREHPDLAQLLDTASNETPTQRLEHAAQLAQQRASTW
ncbi:DUF4123 domain-containing protein [Pseudomonas sp. GD03944]|uniref:DUF4123 domain-containing protein n=1 Tax=Pseudomonas sp. GD03944 TaxID=2975409 RepID=UPI00244A0C37|nr:DUF4123 domain-containing protein [Pseudomonas sp. GD03944]MDH1263803.1 DUF4123 domain-containing protein [Pseudomonas sp. GD03944]